MNNLKIAGIWMDKNTGWHSGRW